VLRLLKSYLRPAFWLLAAVVVFQAAQSVLTLYLPHVTADIIDRASFAGTRATSGPGVSS
jgi:ATP-binding cassette subfamily B protein